MFDEKNHLGTYTEQEVKLLKKLSKTIKDEHKWKIIGFTASSTLNVALML
jgi:hypothetical protein